MSKQLLVRNVPRSISEWIDAQREQHQMTQQEFVLSVLKNAWELEQSERLPLFRGIRAEPHRAAPEQIPFKFVDVFAGIGGFRVALSKLGGECVFSCEWDRYSQKTYKAWFDEMPTGDIRKVNPAEIPDHDVLAAGFPCQPFSIAGVSKRNSLGLAHGFKASQGNLFFSLATIIEAKRPPVLFLENVKNLKSHDQGRTWKVIHETLESMDYVVFHKIIDAADWVPQHRERIYIVCFDRKVFGANPPFEYPEPPSKRPNLSQILEEHPDSKYTLTEHLWSYLQRYAAKHKAKGNGFGFGIADPDGVSRTLSARYYKDGSEILIKQGEELPPRRLTPRECALLMGFDPDAYPVVVSDTQAYRQFGNAVVPKVVEPIMRQINKVLAWQLVRSGCLLKKSRNRVSQLN